MDINITFSPARTQSRQVIRLANIRECGFEGVVECRPTVRVSIESQTGPKLDVLTIEEEKMNHTSQLQKSPGRE